MKSGVIKVVPANPAPGRGSRGFLAELLAAVAKVTRQGWHQLAEFSEKPRQAHWYSARLKTKHPDGYEFCATTTDGVGRVYCRRTPAGA